MKAILLPIFILFALCILPAVPARAQSQAEMNAQAFADFKKADAELNKVYGQVIAKLDTEGKEKLKAAQRAWVVFRDAQAEVDADGSRGGTIVPLLRATSMTESTQTRIKQLRALLKDLSN